MKERLCDLFASEMLISKEVFIQKIGANRKDISLHELRDLQVQYGISIDALMYKAKTLNIITDRRHRGYCIKKNTYPEFKIEVEKSLAKTECTNRFSRLVYRALACETISISKASTLLDIPINEIRNGLNLM
jgi:Zn-dependent peptidase ImmA (M78 family)